MSNIDYKSREKEKKGLKLDPNWRIRRAVVLATLFFGAGVIVYLLGWGANTRLNETIASGMMFLDGMVIMAYVFGVVLDDKTKAVGKT